MKDQLLFAWHTHQDKNLLLLRNIPEKLFSATLFARGRTVADQIAHFHNVRLNWTEHIAKPLFQKNLLLSKEVNLTPAVLAEALRASAAIIAEVIDKSWEKQGKLPSFKAGLIPFVSYLISHESHHRGSILLTLKQNGFSLPDQLKWGLWEWQK